MFSTDIGEYRNNSKREFLFIYLFILSTKHISEGLWQTAIRFSAIHIPLLTLSFLFIITFNYIHPATSPFHITTLY